MKSMKVPTSYWKPHHSRCYLFLLRIHLNVYFYESHHHSRRHILVIWNCRCHVELYYEAKKYSNYYLKNQTNIENQKRNPLQYNTMEFIISKSLWLLHPEKNWVHTCFKWSHMVSKVKMLRIIKSLLKIINQSWQRMVSDVETEVSFFSLCYVLLLLLLLHVCVRLNLWQNSKTSFCLVKIFLYITLSCHKPYHNFRYFFAFRGLFFHIFIFFVCYTLKANKS